jgi:hypothetical protein
MEDAWYELEGAYEVYGIGRYRFVMPHCRKALLIGLALLVRKNGQPASGVGVGLLLKNLGMPENLVDHCVEIEDKGRILAVKKHDLDDPERSATVLSETLEAFEWIRREIDAP